MDRQDGGSAADGAPLGRVLVQFALARALLLVVCFLLARLLVDDVLLALALAFLASAVLGVPLLRPFRARMGAAAADRARRRTDG